MHIYEVYHVRKKNYDPGLVKVGELFMKKRMALGHPYQTREGFIDRRSVELFSGETWISLRHLSNLELGKIGLVSKN